MKTNATQILRKGLLLSLFIWPVMLMKSHEANAQSYVSLSDHFVPLGWYAHTPSVSKVYTKTVDFSFDNTPLEDALEEIAKKGNIRLSYDGANLVNHKVTVTARNLTVVEAFGKILEETELDVWASPSGQVVIKELFPDQDLKEAFVQETITGRVTDADTGEPMPGVNIAVKGTTTGTSSSAEGTYELEVHSLSDTLIFSFIGYNSQTVPISGRTTIDVQLIPAVIGGDEVVVVGYGTQREITLTGSIASVSTRELNSVAVGSVQQALKGRVAGMKVTSDGGPGEDPVIQIRGISSISFATDPLFVVDGIATNNISGIGSSDIASVQVLKDASAAAIYGSRATNGVILITTKKGAREGGLDINYDSYVGTQSPWNKIDLLNTQQYLEYERALNGAAGISMPERLATGFDEPIYEGASRTYAQTNTDWQDAYFKSGLLTNHHLSLSGGNENSRFYVSGGYYSEEGITVGLDYERGSLRINSEHYLSDMVTVGENLYLAYGRQRFDNDTGTRTRLISVIRSLPYLPVHDPTTMGGFRTAANSIDGADPTNPVQDAVLLGQAHNNLSQLLGTAYVNMDFTPWLSFRSTFGLDRVHNFQHQFSPIYNAKGTSATVSTIADATTTSTKTLFTQQLTFNKDFGKHRLKAVAVYEYQETNNMNSTSSGNRNSNAIETLTGASNIAYTNQESKTRMISYIGRINYDYADKYLLSLAIRRDGLSIWAPDNKWANFPSASVGWRVDQEAFMDDLDFISEMKLRAGYGITGLNGLLLGSNYPWQVPLQISGATYPFGNENSVGNATYYNAIGNPDMEWEKTSQLSLGLDLGLLQNRVTLTAEYYRRKTDNLLLRVPTPSSFGLDKVGYLANVGDMENNGFDLQVGYHHYGDDFSWNLTGLVSVVRNNVLALNTDNAAIFAGGAQDLGGGEPFTNTEAGHPIQSFYGYVVDGIFQTPQEVANSPFQTDDTAPGDIKFKDLNNDDVINSADRTYIGSYIPDFSYSLNYNARFKNFDLSLFIQGVQGNDIFNAAGIIREGMARLFGAGTAVLDAWTPQNTDTDIPRAISGDPNKNSRPSNRWIEDGSYIRLKNIQLGYNVPASTLASVTNNAIKDLRIYVSSQNLFTITGYSGWDPEIGHFNNISLLNGVDYGQYPVARSFLVGVEVGL